MNKQLLIKIGFLLFFIFGLMVFTSIEKKNHTPPKTNRKPLPLREAVKILDPNKYMTDDDVKELFCKRVCSAYSSGRW